MFTLKEIHNPHLDLTYDPPDLDPSTLPDSIVEQYGQVTVINDSHLIGGTKMRAAEYLIKDTPTKGFIYVVPRYGLAAVAISELCKIYHKKFIGFFPASKDPSIHQRIVLENCHEYHFHRVPSLTTLNLFAKKYALMHGYKYLKQGINYDLVKWSIAKAARVISDQYDLPNDLYCAVSTGALISGLQIAWPEKTFHGIAVARNVYRYEIGRALFYSDPKPFQAKETELPPFDTVKNYDAKVWKFIPKDQPAIFWNVGKEPSLDPDLANKKYLSRKLHFSTTKDIK